MDLKTLYCSKCGGVRIHIKAWVDANTNEYVCDVEDGEFWCDDCVAHVDAVTLPELWKRLADVPVNNDDEIEEDFLCFPKGTSRFDVWHWFDERCPNNLYDDLMLNENTK